MAAKLDGEYHYEKDEVEYDRKFFNEVAEKADQRFKEKQEGVEHAEPVPSQEEQDAHNAELNEGTKRLSKQYKEVEAADNAKPMPKSIDDPPKKTQTRPRTM